MTRNLKALVLAFFAVVAAAALTASAAQAAGEKFHCTAEKCIVAGTTEEGTKHVINTGLTSECHASLQGTVNTKTAESLTLVPSYTECGATGGGGSGTGAGGEGIPANHCAFVFASSTTEGVAAVQIECAAGAKMVYEMPGFCTLSVGEQAIKKGGVHYANAAPGDSTFTVELAVSEIAMSKAGSLCFLFGNTMSITSKLLFHCYKNAGSEPTGTEKTTFGATNKGELSNCWHE